MRRAIQFLALFAMAVTAVAPYAAAQTAALPFTIRVQQGNNVQVIGDGGTLALPADAIGVPVEGSITVTYTGAGSNAFANINQIMLTGSTDFLVTNAPDLSAGPLNLNPAASSFGMRVRFNPTSGRAASGRITIAYNTESLRSSTFTINLAGTAPEFAYTYAVQPNGNSTLLNQGDTIQLPQTAFTETSSVVISVTNRGSGTGAVNSVSLGGSDRFALAGVPFMPAAVEPGKNMTFSVRFTPDDFPAESATVQVAFAGGSLSFSVRGSGLGPWFGYELLTSQGALAVEPGSLITVPDATVGGDKTAVTVRVKNTGNQEGRITTLSITGNGFALIEGPIMPLTLAAGGSFTFKIQFSPTQPGKTAGRLRVGQDNFDVESNALGANLTYAYAAAGGTISVASGGTVIVPAVAVGQTSSVKFTVKNEGTAPQDIFSISAAGTGTVFGTAELPSLPRKLEAGASVTFSVTFAPVTTGSATGTLKIDTQTFALSAVGNPPAALPQYSFQGASGAVEPAQQPAVGLSLAENYGLPVTGVLTLNFTSDVFANDPAVQFASGGRTINFTIPAGSKQAVFPNGATQIRLQTGTVAGTISLTPSFATAAGGIDLTPVNPPSLNLTVAQSAPRLLNAIVSAKTSNTITLQITGYATGRAITQMDFQFTAVSGETLGTSKVTIPAEATFNAWFQSATSVPYGSQFTATVPFTLSGDIKATDKISNVADTIQSLSVTLTNRQGVSAAQQVTLK